VNLGAGTSFFLFTRRDEMNAGNSELQLRKHDFVIINQGMLMSCLNFICFAEVCWAFGQSQNMSSGRVSKEKCIDRYSL
jgi:hypothetical protein